MKQHGEFFCACMQIFATRKELRLHVKSHKCNTQYKDQNGIIRVCVQSKGHSGKHWGWPTK